MYGKKLKELFKAKGVKQKELSKLLNIPETTISSWTNQYYPRLENNWITRHMEQQIFGQCYRRLVNSAQRQQGLIHLYRTFCIERKCAQCQVGGA